MFSQRIFVQGRTFESGDAALQEALAAVYETPERPQCLCVADGIEMYIARYRRYVVKRMPGTGPAHHPSCVAFEPEHVHSGLGELLGKSVIEHAPDAIELLVRFPWARVPGRAVRHGTRIEEHAIPARQHRMSLRAVLHLLYERAGFNRWYPAMSGKRGQGTLCKYLMAAAHEVHVHGERLSERMYVPEPFNAVATREITERRSQKLAILHRPDQRSRSTMALLIGEVKASKSSCFGRTIWLRHMPDVALHIDEEAWRKAERGQEEWLQASDADIPNHPRLLMAALVYSMREQTYHVHTLTLMPVTGRYLPIESRPEQVLLDRLCTEGRAFLKPLRYDAQSTAAFPSVLLLDAAGDDGRPCEMHVVGHLTGEKVRAAKERVPKSGQNSWLWYADQEMPPFPKKAQLAKRTGLGFGGSGKQHNAPLDSAQTRPAEDDCAGTAGDRLARG